MAFNIFDGAYSVNRPFNSQVYTSQYQKMTLSINLSYLLFN